MKLLDVKDGYIKVELSESVYPSSFLKIDDGNKSYIAQVIQTAQKEGKSFAYAKLLFLYDEEYLPYDNSVPSLESNIYEYTKAILESSIITQTPIIIGKTYQQNYNITIDNKAFNKKTLVSIDDKSHNNLLVQNLAKQFNSKDKNTVIIDTLGIINAKKVVAGKDFKLPLNTASLAFMYKDCLNDATADSKSMIIEIFKDLSEYSETVPFVPFAALKTIVDNMVDKSHIFKLLVLKNKLAKFDKLGYFATTKQEVDVLSRILNSKNVVIDLSQLDTAFQNRYLAYLYEYLKNSENTQVILEVSNTVSKKNLKNILSDDIQTTFVTHSNFQYLNDIKQLFDNFIVAPSLSNNKIFNIYGLFLREMPSDSYLIVGEATNYIPLISKFTSIEDFAEANEAQTNEESDEDFADLLEGNTEELKEVEETDNTIETKSETAILEAVVDLPEQPETMDLFSSEPDETKIEEEPVQEIIKDGEPLETTKETFSTEVHPSEIVETEEVPIKPTEELEESIEEVPSIENVENELEETEPQIIEVQEDFEQEELDEVNDEIIPEYREITEEEGFEPEEGLNVIDNLNTYEEIPESIHPEIEEDTELAELTEIAPEPEDNNDIEEINENIEEDLNIEISEDLDLDLGLSEDSDEVTEEENEHVISDSEDDIDEISIIPLNAKEEFSDENIVELDSDNLDDDNMIIVDLSDEEQNDEDINIDEEIVKDVDKVFTTRKEEEITDSDLDFIDELNNDSTDEDVLETNDDILEELTESSDDILEELSEDTPEEITEEIQEDSGIIEQDAPIEDYQPIEEAGEILETRNASTPMVPVYSADIPQEDLVMSDPIEQGDLVTHAKYGNGVVEKMIKYGSKTLYSINFDNVGRRLLDPTLTEIKKN